MKYDFDKVIDRRHDPRSYSMKWSDAPLLSRLLGVEKIAEDSIPLCTADMDFRCPQPVIDAMIDTAKYGLYGYTCTFSTPEYAQSIIGWFKRRYSWEIHEEELMFSPGTLPGMRACIQEFTEPGDGVIIQRPVYGPFATITKGVGRTVVDNPLMEGADGYYTMDFDDLEKKAADPHNKILFLCNPHNPVGRVWKPEELRRVGEICSRNHVLVVSDEVHCDLTRRGITYTPAATVMDNQNLIVCTALNKTFNVAGLACTNLVIPNPAIRERMANWIGFESPSSFGIAGTIAAYQEGEDWLEQVNDYLDGNIDFAIDFIKQHMPKAHCRRPEGTYILWLDLRGYGLSAEEIHRRIYNDAQVMLEGGLMFDPDRGAGFERICVSCSRTVLEEALTRISKQFENV